MLSFSKTCFSQTSKRVILFPFVFVVLCKHHTVFFTLLYKCYSCNACSTSSCIARWSASLTFARKDLIAVVWALSVDTSVNHQILINYLSVWVTNFWRIYSVLSCQFWKYFELSILPNVHLVELPQYLKCPVLVIVLYIWHRGRNYRLLSFGLPKSSN